MKPIPRIGVDQWKTLVRRGDVGRKPLVVSAAFSSTQAVETWTPESIARRFADRRVPVAVNLPEKGSPYDNMRRMHHRRMTVAEFMEYLPDHPGSYLAQASLSNFAGMAEELGISHETAVPPVRTQNLWIGNSTRSGLHFDLADGLLVQVYGAKTATLVREGQFSDIYAYPDIHMKSRVDPDDFDEKMFPKFVQVDRFTANLTPGDALFIPRLWWHHLVSEDISVSVNAWFGQTYSSDFPMTVLRAGPAVWRKAARDFLAIGMLRRDYEQRLFSGKPSGLRLYETLTGSKRR